MESINVALQTVYWFGLVLYGCVVFERIKPKTINEISVFILTCIFWPIVCLGILVLAMLSALRNSRNGNNSK